MSISDWYTSIVRISGINIATFFCFVNIFQSSNQMSCWKILFTLMGSLPWTCTPVRLKRKIHAASKNWRVTCKGHNPRSMWMNSISTQNSMQPGGSYIIQQVSPKASRCPLSAQTDRAIISLAEWRQERDQRAKERLMAYFACYSYTQTSLGWLLWARSLNVCGLDGKFQRQYVLRDSRH